MKDPLESMVTKLKETGIAKKVKIEKVPKGNKNLYKGIERDAKDTVRIIREKTRKSLPEEKTEVTSFADGVGTIYETEFIYKEDKKWKSYLV